MEIIGRKQWGARPPRHRPTSIAAASRLMVVVHHSGGPADQSVRSIQDWCIDSRGFSDIDYNFLVDQGGRVYTGRGWAAVGSHAKGYNRAGWGFCVIGNDQISAGAKAGLRALYAQAADRAGHPLRQLVHSDVGQTKCPGGKIRGWVHGGGLAAVRDLGLRPVYLHGPDVEAVQRIVGVTPDGVFGPVTERAVRVWQHGHRLVADGVVGPLTRAAMGLS